MVASRKREKCGIKHQNSHQKRRRVWVQRERTDKPIRNCSLKTKTPTDEGEGGGEGDDGKDMDPAG